ERLLSYGRNRAGRPRELVGVDDYVAPLPTRELPQLHEQDASRFRKRGMAKAFRIEEQRARGPVTMFVGEDNLEYQHFLSLRMVVRREPRSRLVAHDRRDLARFRRPHQVDSLSPDRPARTRHPLHQSRVGDGSDRKISVDRLYHRVLPLRALWSTIIRGTKP